jgi:hypothetical protein
MKVTRRAFIASSSLAATIALANCIPMPGMVAGDPSGNVSVANSSLTFRVRGWEHLCEPDTEAMLIEVTTVWRSGWH